MHGELLASYYVILRRFDVSVSRSRLYFNVALVDVADRTKPRQYSTVYVQYSVDRPIWQPLCPREMEPRQPPGGQRPDGRMSVKVKSKLASTHEPSCRPSCRTFMQDTIVIYLLSWQLSPPAAFRASVRNNAARRGFVALFRPRWLSGTNTTPVWRLEKAQSDGSSGLLIMRLERGHSLCISDRAHSLTHLSGLFQ